MLYYIYEQQTSDNNTGAALVTTKATRQEADQVFFTIMATASVSAVPKHGAMIVDSDMFVLRNELAYRPPVEQAEE